MLDKIEHKIMSCIFMRCRGRKTVLIAPKEILDEIATSPRFELTAKQLENAIKNLMLDGYINVYHSDNKGTLNYVISLTVRGEAYQREIDDVKSRRIRSIGWKVLLTVVGFAVLTVLGLIFVVK